MKSSSRSRDGQQAGEDADVLVVGLDVAAEGEAVALARGEADGFVRNQRVDEAFEVVEVGVAVGLVPTGGGGAAGEQDGEGFAFLVPGLAAAGVAEDAAHFEETQGFRLLADVSRGGGDETGNDARAHDGVVLAEREFHADDVAVLQGAQRQGVG